MGVLAAASAVLTAASCGKGSADSAASPTASPPAASQPAAGDQKERTPRVVELKHLRVDLTRRRVVMDARVCLPDNISVLEFLVCKGDTKTHESILTTDAEARMLHAGLLMLGLTPGKPAKWVYDEEGDQTKAIAPRGGELRITLRWKDKEGKVHEADAGSWLKPSGKVADSPPLTKWVFVGSEVLPDGRYWADDEGQVISVANFASSVIDVPFESSSRNVLSQYAAKREAIPSRQTPVEVVIAPLPGAERAPHARALLEIDDFGRLTMDSRPIAPQRLRPWAESFIAEHARGMVTIRAAARTTAWDVAAAEEELRLGGVFDTEVQRVKGTRPLLPRTPEQKRWALQQWAEKFANPQDYIRDPAQESEEVLRQVEQRIAELKAVEWLLQEYAADLRRAREAYEASTRPAPEAPVPPEPTTD
jgi:hypothetical protein